MRRARRSKSRSHAAISSLRLGVKGVLANSWRSASVSTLTLVAQGKRVRPWPQPRGRTIRNPANRPRPDRRPRTWSRLPRHLRPGSSSAPATLAAILDLPHFT